MSKPGVFAVFTVDPKTNYPMEMVFGPNNHASCKAFIAKQLNWLKPYVLFEIKWSA